MSVDIVNLTAASIKAKNVATETYVDNSTGDIITNIYVTGTTQIDGGKIATDTITADKIITNGLIAENVFATELYGKNLYGAYIEGAVIKASYLDLSGQIQILTNYHLWATQADMDAGIAAGQKGELYTNEIDMVGAIYMSGQNEWRLPSMSSLTIYDISRRLPTIADATCQSGYKVVTGAKIYQDDFFGAFNSYSINTTKRLVKDRPSFTVETSTSTLKSSQSTYGGDITLIKDYNLWFFNINLGTVDNVWFANDQLHATYQGQTVSVPASPTYLMVYTQTINATINGIKVVMTLTSGQYSGYLGSTYRAYSVSLGLAATDTHLPTVDLSGIGGVAVEYIGLPKCGGTIDGYGTFPFPKITVNNLI